MEQIKEKEQGNTYKKRRMNKRITKAESIRLKCLECGGESPKEVTLCHLFECPLWQYRFGYSNKDKRYRRRMEAALKKYSADFEELRDIGINISNFLLGSTI